MIPIASRVSVDESEEDAIAIRSRPIQRLIGKVQTVPLNRCESRVDIQRYGVFGDDIFAAGAVDGAGELNLTISFPQIAAWSRVSGNERSEPITNAVGIKAYVIVRVVEGVVEYHDFCPKVLR